MVDCTFVISLQLGIRKMTPDGLLLGATNIVSQNKQLRKEMTDLEREITSLRQQNTAMVCMCVLYILLSIFTARGVCE